jgi:predicted nucleic-acid-binding protein
MNRVYGLSRAEIARAVEAVLQADTLSVQNEQEVFVASVALKQGKGSFSDASFSQALIAALSTWAGCEKTLTFDRKAAQLAEFELPEPLT